MIETVIETKKCKVCGEVKPVDQFDKAMKNKSTGKQYYQAKCKCCRRKYRKEYSQKPEVKERKKEYNKEYNKEYYQKPEVKERKKEYHNIQRAIRYGAPYSSSIKDQYKETVEILNYTCAYCGVELTPDNEQWEHIIPLSAGGTSTPDNIVCSCASCNLSKHVRPMEEWYREQPFFSEERLQRIYAVRDHWKAVGFEIVYPTEEQIQEAHSVAEEAIGTVQSMSRLKRDPYVINQYI